MVRIYSGSRVIVQLKAAEVIEGEILRIKHELKKAVKAGKTGKAKKLKEELVNLHIRLDEC